MRFILSLPPRRSSPPVVIVAQIRAFVGVVLEVTGVFVSLGRLKVHVQDVPIFGLLTQRVSYTKRNTGSPRTGGTMFARMVR